MEKIAILSDIHGNLEALKAVLEDSKKLEVTRYYCLGDTIGKGEHNHECLELIKETCNENSVLGNYEEEYKLGFSKVSGLTKEDQEYISNLNFSIDFFLSGRRVRLFHSTPYNTFEYFLPTDDIKATAQMFAPSIRVDNMEMPDIVVCGHTHMPYSKRLLARDLIGVGSVGESVELFQDEFFMGDVRNVACANYLLLDGEFGDSENFGAISYTHRRVPYDIDKELGNNPREERVKVLKYGITPKQSIYLDIARDKGIKI